MKKLLTPLILLAGTLLLPCGCTNVGAIAVTGLHIEVTAIELETDSSVAVAWQVVNPNVASYLVASVSNKIYLNGTLVGTVFTNDPLGLPPQKNVTKNGKLTLAGPAADRLLREAAGHGPVNYRVDSLLVIQMYGDDTSKGQLTHSGSVTVVSK